MDIRGKKVKLSIWVSGIVVVIPATFDRELLATSRTLLAKNDFGLSLLHTTAAHRASSSYTTWPTESHLMHCRGGSQSWKRMFRQLW